MTRIPMSIAIVFVPLIVLAGDLAVVLPESASSIETLAAREVIRYAYVRTGDLLPISMVREAPAGGAIVVARKDRPVAVALAREGGMADLIASLGAQEYALRTIGPRRLLVAGGDDIGVLYGAYRLVEHLGVRFYLHGDVVPDRRIPLALPELAERGSPLFPVRGILPFHDFFEGPDWWDEDDWKAYASQLAKMRMNFIGLHNYPVRAGGYPSGEPTVWIGLPEDVDARGRVKAAYPAFFANTLRPGWGNIPMRTSGYAGGAARIFEHDAFGPDVQIGRCPWPERPEDAIDVFERTAAMYRSAFTLARALGIKTCAGTETPLTIPESVQQALKARGLDPKDPASARLVYAGMFTRLARAIPLDYYWLWTDEGWTWGNPAREAIEAVERDLRLALEALRDAKAPFGLATCGWVLGPPGDRQGFDKILPKDVPLSCINREVGHAPVEPAFALIKGRPTWAIPWLENDPNMVAPQPWVGRMLFDAADALRFGCTGLLGIHWRTKVIGMNIAAIAQAGWTPPPAAAERPEPEECALGGNATPFTGPVAGTDETPVYRSVRWDTDGYRLRIPDGTYTITLKFVEPAYDRAGARVFGARIQGKSVLERLDMFERAGKDRAIDLAFPGIRVASGRLAIDFIRIIEFPCIAGIAIEGTADAKDGAPARPFVRKINCGGPAWKGYEADLPVFGTRPGHDRALPCRPFYIDWATAHFGAEAGPLAGDLFARIDGRSMHEPSQWGTGPGLVRVNGAPWEEERKRYAFVDDLEALRPRVRGAGNIERFDYWLETYRFMRAMAQVGCAAGKLGAIVAEMSKEADPARQKEIARTRALPIRIELARLWEAMIRHQLAAVSTPGEMGTIANLEQQSRGAARILDRHDAAIEKALGTPLPSDLLLSAEYEGPSRIIVPTVRGLIEPGEALTLKVIVLAPGDTGEHAEGEILWRPMGRGEFARVPWVRVARCVFRATLPPPPADSIAIEYYLRARAGGETLLFPATAPEMNQTVVLSSINQSPEVVR